MRYWAIDRLALTVPGYSQGQARELAACLATALADADAPQPAAKGDHSRLHLELAAHAGESMPELARRIAAALLAAA
jgi:hypothetical protein